MSQNPIIKKGYKQTEIGVIPEDWEIAEISDLFQFQGGSQPAKDFFSFSSKDGYIRLLQIRDYKGDKYETYIPARLARRHCDIDDIMIGRYGPPIFQILKGLTGAYNVALIKAIPSKKIIRSYGWYIMKQEKLFSFIEKLSQRSSGQTGVDLDELRKYKQPLPTTEEQSAIASILSDTDALIENLDKLIEKKKAIKQGTMQELLTGKRRLPGFSGEWEIKKLGDFGVFKGGNGFPIKYQGVEYGNYPFYKVSDMNNFGNGIFMSTSNNWINESDLRVLGLTIFPGNTIVFAKIGAAIFLERKKILSKASCIDNNMMGYIFDQKYINPRFIHYFFHTIKLGKLVSASALPSLNGNQIAELKYNIPGIEEQYAIATILSDIDSEIESLESKRNKYQSIKQGMMQELLTGNIRVYGHN